MRRTSLILALTSSILLSGCVASVVKDVVTAPVKVASKAVDVATTSQSEADENRGRELRKREERLGKLERRYDKQIEDCRDGDEDACDEARETYEEIQEILPTVPVEPER